MPTKTATKRAPAKKAPAKTAAPKSQARVQDSAKLSFQAEAVLDPSQQDETHLAAERNRAELQRPGRASKADAAQIDNDPGYDRDQLAHMREYWGLKPDESTVEAEQGQVIEVVE
jgi:hypothetical protein